jgi:hypothetical protein
MLTNGQKQYIEELVLNAYSHPASTVKLGLVLVVDDGDESETAEFVHACLAKGRIIRPAQKSTYKVLPESISFLDQPIIIDKSQNILWGRKSNRLQIAINCMVSFCNSHELLVLVSNGSDIHYIETVDARLEWRLRDRLDVRAGGIIN